MAGEWIPIDIGLGLKPEIQELVDLTGQAVETVVYRLIQMWGWVSINTADGTIRATPARVARICGGDADFWLAVETVGWLKFNSEAGIMTVSGWEARFSKAAKARAADRIRKSIERQQDSGVCPDSVQETSADSGKESGLQERRGQERTVPPPPPPPRARDEETGKAASEVVAAWIEAQRASGGKLAPFEGKRPPKAIWDRLADPAWAEQALAAIERLPRCRYFDDPPTIDQLCGIKGGETFVERVLVGKYDSPKRPKTLPGAPADGRPTAAQAVERFQKRDPARDAMVREYREAKARKAGKP
jgi:hypothetical protein